jgi:hypothetical protein
MEPCKNIDEADAKVKAGQQALVALPIPQAAEGLALLKRKYRGCTVTRQANQNGAAMVLIVPNTCNQC